MKTGVMGEMGNIEKNMCACVRVCVRATRKVKYVCEGNR